MRRLSVLLAGALVGALVLTTAPAGMAALVGKVLYRPVGGDDVITLLVLGSDAGPSPRSYQPGSSNADAFHLVFVSKNRRHASIVNIPRDSYVPVAGAGTTRINACLFGGPDRCVRTVESLFDVDVDHHVLLTMRGFATAMRNFGGLEVDVEHPVSDGGDPVREAGRQQLSGLQVLAYARDRKNRPRGDFTRSTAQGKVMALAHRKVRSQGTVDAVTSAVELLRTYTVTDIPPGRMLTLAFTAMELPPKNVGRTTLNGSVGFAGSASVVHLHDSAYRQVREARDGRLDN